MEGKKEPHDPFEEMVDLNPTTKPSTGDESAADELAEDRRFLKHALDSIHGPSAAEIDYSLLLSSFTHGVIALSETGKCLYANAAATEMLGRDESTLIGEPFHENVLKSHKDGSPYPYEASPLYAALIFQYASRGVEEMFSRADQSMFPVSYSVSPILVDATVTGAVLVFEDITTRRLLETQLAQSDRMTSLGRLAASVAHEFDEVLQRIQPAVELIERNAASNGELQLALGMLEQSAERGRRLARKIHQYTDSKRPAMEPIDVVQWMSAFVEHVRRVIPPTIVLEIKLPPEPLYVLGDPVQLNQVFMNLILNARDAMPRGGRLTLGVELCLSGTKFAFGVIETPDQFVHFTVADTGTGIAPQIMPRIFEPLFTTKATSSAGLGLAVCHELVQRHGGSIFAESSPNEGTTLHLFIPTTYPEIFRDDKLRDTEARRVILVEDPSGVTTTTNLADFGDLELEIVSRGKDLAKLVETFEPNAIVLHASRLEIDGFELYFEIAKEWASIPILISTMGVSHPRGRKSAPPNVSYLPYDVEMILKSLEAASS